VALDGLGRKNIKKEERKKERKKKKKIVKIVYVDVDHVM